MIYEQTEKVSLSQAVKAKTLAYVQLLKLRLSLLVALSAVFGYAIAAGSEWTAYGLFAIGLGGLMITGASNALNQLFEKELDALMKRTALRPIPTGRISSKGALIFALLLSVSGVAVIGRFFNLPAALLGVIGLLSYAFVYTPMKRVSPASVFIGAIPGGLPPLIGWVAFTGSIDAGGLILFVIQFLWQFPHFWAIAWLLDEDYQRAGFKMLPSVQGKTTFSALMILIYTLSLIPVVVFPVQAGLIGWSSAGVLALLGVVFCWPAWKLYRTMEAVHARKLMFASFMYLPLAQLVFLF
ncbi:MAG: heme o synthase [Bacteroidia bacterium]|nr:heme o synthase [Bacteroidia bacterium]